MRIIHFDGDVNTYNRIISTDPKKYVVALDIHCDKCKRPMPYHGCYEVNYISQGIETKLTVVRIICSGLTP